MPEPITYDEIYELLRAEKNSADLEELKPSVIERIRAYLVAKRALLNQPSAGVFSGVRERAKILTEIENVRNAIKDLFEKRERKIINRALYTIRTDLKMKDTTNMLESEIELYNSLLEVFKKDREVVMSIIDEAEQPPQSPASEPVSEEPKKDSLDESEAAEEMLEFLEDVPELIGSDLKKRGPFSRGQIAAVPSDLASLLVTQKKAKVYKH